MEGGILVPGCHQEGIKMACSWRTFWMKVAWISLRGATATESRSEQDLSILNRYRTNWAPHEEKEMPRCAAIHMEAKRDRAHQFTK
jgi:hypothetical protein